MNKKPKITIITVCKNSSSTLEETIKSIVAQKYNNIEYIIIDGKSNDGTLSIIEKYKKHINLSISETDNGIYDAFNKGISMCRGEYICIINSDDIFTKNALNIYFKYLNNNKKLDFIFGSVKKHWGILHGYKPEKISYSWGFYSSHSTGFVIKNSAAKIVGKYNLKYKYHADYDYFYRMIVQKKLIGTATKKEEVVGIFRRGGFSSTVSFWKKFREELAIRLNNNQSKFLVLIIFIYKFIRNLDKIIKK